MEAKELRIGNIVCFFMERSTYLIGIIESINKKTVTIRSFGKSYSVKYVNLNPVQLTEEILLKCGFAVLYTIGGFLRWQLGDFKLIDRKLPYPCRHKMDIKYLHQLQNLYFSLTGEEIDVSKLFE